MPGTKAGGLKAYQTNIKLYGKDFYKIMGAKGGKVCCPKGFALNIELAKAAGRKGGKMHRPRRKKNESNDDRS